VIHHEHGTRSRAMAPLPRRPVLCTAISGQSAYDRADAVSREQGPNWDVSLSQRFAQPGPAASVPSERTIAGTTDSDGVIPPSAGRESSVLRWWLSCLTRELN
jgi:hypothetical protein